MLELLFWGQIGLLSLVAMKDATQGMTVSTGGTTRLVFRDYEMSLASYQQFSTSIVPVCCLRYFFFFFTTVGRKLSQSTSTQIKKIVSSSCCGVEFNPSQSPLVTAVQL